MVLMSTYGLCSINQSALFAGLIVKGENSIVVALRDSWLHHITQQIFDRISNFLIIVDLYRDDKSSIQGLLSVICHARSLVSA